jgi:hypothetical protein
MSITGQLVVGGVVLYLVLLARSAWKQGEFKQFLWGIVIVTGLLVAVAGIIWAWIVLGGA